MDAGEYAREVYQSYMDAAAARGHDIAPTTVSNGPLVFYREVPLCIQCGLCFDRAARVPCRDLEDELVPLAEARAIVEEQRRKWERAIGDVRYGGLLSCDDTLHALDERFGKEE